MASDRNINLKHKTTCRCARSRQHKQSIKTGVSTTTLNTACFPWQARSRTPPTEQSFGGASSCSSSQKRKSYNIITLLSPSVDPVTSQECSRSRHHGGNNGFGSCSRSPTHVTAQPMEVLSTSQNSPPALFATSNRSITTIHFLSGSHDHRNADQVLRRYETR